MTAEASYRTVGYMPHCLIMNAAETQVVQNTISFVKETLQNAEGGHDWFHIQRVQANALLIAQGEAEENQGTAVNLLVVRLGALLHDIADAKFHDGDESVGPRMAREFLTRQDARYSSTGERVVTDDIIGHVEQIIRHISFKSRLKKETQSDGTNSETQSSHFSSPELRIVQDADRLDALGAIGIARCFNYGGFKHRPLYDPDVAPKNAKIMTQDQYQTSTTPTINHFYEKLLLLKDTMNTKTGRRIAAERHQYMEGFLHQFYEEWEGRR